MVPEHLAVFYTVGLNPNNYSSDDFPCSVILYCSLEKSPHYQHKDIYVPREYAFCYGYDDDDLSTPNYLYKYSAKSGTKYYNISAIPGEKNDRGHHEIDFIVSS